MLSYLGCICFLHDLGIKQTAVCREKLYVIQLALLSHLMNRWDLGFMSHRNFKNMKSTNENMDVMFISFAE